MQLSPGALIEYVWNGTQPIWAALDEHRRLPTTESWNVQASPEGTIPSVVVSFLPSRGSQAPIAYVVLPTTIGWMYVWGSDATYPSGRRLQSVLEFS